MGTDHSSERTEIFAGDETESSTERAFRPFNTLLERVFSAGSIIMINALALIALAAVAVSTWGVGLELFRAIGEGDMTSFTHVITSALTVFIFIEVLAVSVRYLRIHKIDLKDLIDVTLAIIFREIWLALFSHSMKADMIFALAALIGVLGLARWLSAGASISRADDAR